MEGYDVVVLGGGPAGAAVALRLARSGRRVALVERSRYERARPGETFGPEVGPLLRDLGVPPDLAAVPFRGVQSAWGSSDLGERESIFHPLGEGWHVDRAAFDRVLADCAARAGAHVMTGAGASAISRADGLWQVRPATGEALTARFLVDASGRGAPATAPRISGRRWLQADREVAVVGAMTAPALALEPVLLLEAVEEGWWYSVPQRDGVLLMVLITDADLLPARGPQALAAHFAARLAATQHSSARAAGAELSAPPWIVRADSGVLRPARGEGWRAVGDAAHGGDPLGGDGVARALRAAEEAARDLEEGAPPVEERFREHLALRERYCAAETRWPDAPFWARRRPIDWRGAPLLLDPRAVLNFERDLTPAQAAPVEALLTADGLRELLALLRAPAPAHQALRMLADLVPFEQRRLLIGLQLLQALATTV